MALDKPALIKFAVFLVFIAIVIYIFRYSPFSSGFTAENIKEFVGKFGFLSFLVFVLIYAAGTIAAIPGVMLTFAGAILFGTLLGALLNLVGAVIGASGAFFLAKALGRDFVQKMLKGRLDVLKREIEKRAFKGILFLRLIPAFPFTVINYGCGLLNVKFRDYFLATVIGMIPAAFIYTYLFATVGEKALMGNLNVTDVLTPQIVIPIVLFLLLLFFPVVYKRLKKSA